MDVLLRLWASVRRSGWFSADMTGGIFPFPQSWQAWAMTAALIVGLSLTAFVPPDIGWACRISMCVGYIGLGMLTYE